MEGDALRLDVLDPIFHLLGLKHLSDEHQRIDDFAERASVLVAVDNPSMWHATGVQREIILILAKNDSAFGLAELKVLLIGGTEQPGIGRRRHVDAAAS
jgi:hypothetical protein